jgi:glycosyltransferase
MNIVFLTCENLAGNYGVGTYINSLIKYFSTKKQVKIFVIEVFYTKRLEISQAEKKRVHYLYIPRPLARTQITDLNEQEKESYTSKVIHIVKSHIDISGTGIIHVNYHPLFFIAAALRKEFEIPIISTIHMITWKLFFDLNTKMFRKVFNPKFKPTKKENLHMVRSESEQITVEQSNKVIFVTKHASAYLGSIYTIAKNKTKVIYNGIPLRSSTSGDKERREIIKKQLGFQPDEQLIIFCGRLTRSKGIYHLINAFKIISLDFPRARLIIIGDGEMNEIIQHTSGIWSNVTFTGYLKKETVYQFYKAADIGVIPSLHEQCSYVAIEMMMHKLPIVVSNADGLNEMFENGKNALTVEAMYDKISGMKICEDSLVRNITTLLNNKELASQLGNAAKDNANEKFSINRMINETILAYQDTINHFNKN